MSSSSWQKLPKSRDLSLLVKRKLRDDAADFFREDETSIYVPRCFLHSKRAKLSPAAESPPPAPNMRPEVQFVGTLEETEMRPQKSAVAAILSAFQTWPKAGIVQLPPGRGKTVIAIAAAVQLHSRTIICVHTSILLDQWIERIRKFAPEARIVEIKGQESLTRQKETLDSADFVVAMLQTLHASEGAGNLPKFGMCIVDEVHHVAATTFFQAVMALDAECMLGLSATPRRNDGRTRILHDVMGPIIFHVEIQADIRGPPLVVRRLQVPETWAAKKPPRKFSDATQERTYYLQKLARNSFRNTWIIDEVVGLLTRDPTRQILILSHFISHLETLKTGILASLEDSKEQLLGLISGKTRKKERARILKEVQIVLATYSLYKEGSDEPRLNTLIMTLPAGNVVQTAGRVMRGNPAGALVLDVVDQDIPLFARMAKSRQTFFTKAGFEIKDEQYCPEEHGLWPAPSLLPVVSVSVPALAAPTEQRMSQIP